MNPLIKFLTPSSELSHGSDTYNIAFLVAHCGFFLFNFVNFCFLLLFEGYATKRLWSNRASLWSLAAHLIQLISCMSSIHRYNINDEFGFWARFGTWTGITAFMFIEVPYLYLLFFNDTRKVSIGMAVVVVFGIASIALSELHWDRDHFKYLGIFGGATIAIHVVALLRARRHLKQGLFTLENGFLSQDTMVRVYEVFVLVICACFSLGPLTGIPILKYPSTGMVYTICMLNSICMGRTSFMKEENVNGAPSTSAERLPLTR
mmetsp:Transcript_13260/g.27811  ORF Transcript_13260/g.27811 Transcript_13260/m.27811 type:complete len:262 (+) Transcript_13260:319-1104(+)